MCRKSGRNRWTRKRWTLRRVASIVLTNRARTGSLHRLPGAIAIAFALLTACGGDSGGSAVDETTVAPPDPPATDVTPAGTGPSATDAPSETAADGPAATDPPVSDPPATDPPVTEPSATDPPVTEPSPDDPGTDLPPDLSFLWNDVETFVAAWGDTNDELAVTDPDVAPVVLAVEDLRVDAMPSAGEGFSATDVEPAGYVAGTIDPGGEVSALVTAVDPTADRARLLLATAMITLGGAWADLDTDEFLADVEAGYLSFETDAASLIGEQVFVAGPFGSPYSAVLTVIDGGDRGAALVEVAVIPVDDEQVALSIVEVLRTEMTGLLT